MSPADRNSSSLLNSSEVLFLDLPINENITLFITVSQGNIISTEKKCDFPANFNTFDPVGVISKRLLAAFLDFKSNVRLEVSEIENQALQMIKCDVKGNSEAVKG